MHDLQSFAMIGTAGRQYVTIIMPIPTEVPSGPETIGNRTYIFANVSNVRIEMPQSTLVLKGIIVSLEPNM